MTREELEEAKNNDTMRDEVQEIADSPAFRRFIDGRSLDELGNLIQHGPGRDEAPERRL